MVLVTPKATHRCSPEELITLFLMPDLGDAHLKNKECARNRLSPHEIYPTEVYF
jgi:hypothetical protein